MFPFELDLFLKWNFASFNLSTSSQVLSSMQIGITPSMLSHGFIFIVLFFFFFSLSLVLYFLEREYLNWHQKSFQRHTKNEVHFIKSFLILLSFWNFILVSIDYSNILPHSINSSFFYMLLWFHISRNYVLFQLLILIFNPLLLKFNEIDQSHVLSLLCVY